MRSAPEPETTLPAPRNGADRLGTRFEEAWIERWIGEPVGFGDSPATLVRFWTDTCGFCSASLPALERIRLDFAAQGLTTLAIYHPKPPRPVEDAAIRAAARRMGYQGPLAADPGWRALRRIWLDGAQRPATSASFLLDRSGRVRFVHPGPLFHPPGEDHEFGVGSELAAADYGDLRRAVRALLAGP